MVVSLHRHRSRLLILLLLLLLLLLQLLLDVSFIVGDDHQFFSFCFSAELKKGCAHTHTYRLIVIIIILSQRKFSNSCTSVIHVQKRGFYSRSRGRHILLSAWLGGCTHTSTHRQWWGVCVRCEHASLVHAKSLICLRVYPIHTVTLHIHVDSSFCLCLSHHFDTEWQTVPIPCTVCGRTDH